MSADNSVFNRPGVSDEFLIAAGCFHCGEADSLKTYGFKAEGIAIPFHTLEGNDLTDNGKPFARVRLYHATDSQKYHQKPGSGVHIYIPHTFAQTPKGSRLPLVEGEFKALALAEGGYAGLGLSGITGAARTITNGESKTDHALHEELAHLLEHHQPAEVIFLGDADVVLNWQFSAEAAKLRRLLFGSRRYRFIEKFTVIALPFDGPKGVDDLCAAKGEAFKDCFESIISSGYSPPEKASAVEIFCCLLKRELERVRVAFTGDDEHKAHSSRVKLLQSAARLRRESGAMLLLRPLLTDLLNVKDRELDRMVRDAGEQEQRPGDTSTKLAGHGTAVEPPKIEPWPHRVNGAELLNRLAAEAERFLWLPQHGATVLACHILYTYVWRSFEYAPILAVTSPTPGCGKGRVLDLEQKLASNPWRTGNATESVLFRIIDERTPLCLIDEFDSLLKETRAAITNILNQAFHMSGRVHRIEGEQQRRVVEFKCFCPVVVACIKTGTFGRATITRCINLRMQKKPKIQKIQRLRKYDGSEWQRKCLRWALDHQAQLESACADFPEELEDRQMDIWEAFFTIAKVVGGDWPERVRSAALVLCGAGIYNEVEDSGVSILRWFKSYFEELDTDRVTSKAICQWLNERPDAGFRDWREGKGIDERALSKALRPFEIQPQNIAIGPQRPKGYLREWFKDAWEAYVSDDNATSDRYSATDPENASRNEVFASATEVPSSGAENLIPTRQNGDSSAVAGKKEEPAPLLL
ncbi:MAG: hypothetical protein C5B50_19535 [Verrucomicrobia bacterium]|nr:MAG: hypothetical protein C5B50_19535 [Verrucomicrobiota bacterium]